MQDRLISSVTGMIQGNFRYCKCRRCSHGISEVLRQWPLPSLLGTLWLLVSGFQSPANFWILSAEQLPLQGSWGLLLCTFGLRMAWACHDTSSKADCDLSVPGPLPPNSLLACVCKFKRKSWTSPAKVECSPWCHQLWHSWEEAIQHTGLPGLCGKGQSCWEWGFIVSLE